MTDPITRLGACTDEELERALLASSRTLGEKCLAMLKCRNFGSSTKRFSGVRSL
jgi:hypothetical protein